MIPTVEEARVVSGYRIWIRFHDGVEGEIDLEEELWGEMFAPLKETATFEALTVHPELGTVVWPNGADFAPEFLYQKLRPSFVLKSTTQSGAA